MTPAIQVRPGEVPTPPWDMPAYALEVYRALGPLTYPDPENGWALAALVDAWSTIGSWVHEAASPRPGTGESPWAAVVDPDRCPWWALAWCGQVYGLRLTPVLDAWVRPDAATEARWRQEIRSLIGWHRGHINTISEAARQHTTGQRRVSIRERYDPDLGSDVDAPYHLSIRVRASDLIAGREAAVIRDVLAAVPIGLIAHVEISDALTYDDLPAAYADYDALNTAYADYDELEGN